MRLGGPTFRASDPESWLAELERSGYRAAYCPLESGAPADVIDAYARAAREADVVIAEVGAWSNPLSPDEAERRDALAFCRRQLALAEAVGARCCVNISGSRGPVWDGPHPDNLTDETFHLIVETVRAIIDAVRPTRTFFTLETMPWMYPDSPESYLRLVRAVNRTRFAVHLDPANLVRSPQHLFNSAALIRECFRTLGPHIRGCHAKDVALSNTLTVHLNEVRPGLGSLDYGAFLRELDKLDPDTPLMLEHLPGEGAYRDAAAHIRSVAASEGIPL